MSHFVFILLVEIILVLSISLIVLIVFNWKKKKQNAAEIERLLAQVEESEATWKQHLVNYLTGQLSMEEPSALEQVEDFIAAEKRFTQQFLEIQLNQQSVSSFYQNRSEFVDKYLQLIAENVPKAINNDLDIAGDVSPEEQKDANNSEKIEEKSKDNEISENDPEIIDSSEEEFGGDEIEKLPKTEVEPKQQTTVSKEEEDEFAE